MSYLLQQSNFNKDAQHPTHIYMDVNIINADKTGLNQPVLLKMNEVRSSSYISNPSDYYMSIVRFSVDTQTLPLLIVEPQTGQADINRLIYTFTMSYNLSGTVIDYQQPVIWEPTDQAPNVALPAPPLDVPDYSGTYYYVYSATYFIELLNKALTACFNGLNSAVIGAGGTLPTVHAPFLEWNPETGRAILNASQKGFNKANPDKIEFYMNTPMYNLFTSYSAFFQGWDVVNGKNFLIDIFVYGGGLNRLIVADWGLTPTDNIALQMYQEYASLLVNGGCVKSIVFLSGTIPVNQSLQSTPQIFNNYGVTNTTGYNAKIEPVLTDFQIQDLTTGYEYKPTIRYTPSAEYRFFDLFGNQALTNLDISVYFRDRLGFLRPIVLTSNSVCNIKILFRHKKYNNF
jgi:hypothetical protein